MKSMEEFFSLAELSEKTFEAEKAKNIVMINENVIVDPKEQERRFLDTFYKGSDAAKTTNLSLRIPRRPLWNKTMKKDELKKKENEAFLQWRKAIAEAEEKNMKLSITPFEKNIDIWRQLWQVIERSQVIVQVMLWC
jgi:large subunit GTPase 1